ncbi:hypothetical protein BG015_000207 [Linnemannia schmuckeri]|uniref:Uncharacterized protein n=1 Tax=Linnemannia schmuckeri TaxID=64567 RepID=A0A9P5RTG9_9FUNG|nr:hypothetical protein BG015_000207 [Linnemannia schmuckeri]
MTSALIQKILVQCSELEELSLYSYNTSVRPLAQADATAESWVSNRIQKLQLRVAIPDLFYLRPKKKQTKLEVLNPDAFPGPTSVKRAAGRSF